MKQVTTHYRCECGNELIATGRAMSNSAGTLYQHGCSKYGCVNYINPYSGFDGKWLTKSYPIVEIEFEEHEKEERWEKDK